METKGIEEMTREDLIELVCSLNRDLEKAKKDARLYQEWKDQEEAAKIVAEKKIAAAKAFWEVM